MSLELRRRMMATDMAKSYDFVPMLYAPQIDGYDENGVELFNTDAYDLNTAEVNIIEKFNKSKLKNKAAIFSILPSATYIKVKHNGTIRIFETINGVEEYKDYKESDVNINLTSGSTHRYAIVYDTESEIYIYDRVAIAEALAGIVIIYRYGSGSCRFKQYYYSRVHGNYNSFAYWSAAQGKVYRVLQSNNYAFQNTNFGQIVIPNTITSIGKGCFQNTPCDVGTLVIPENIESIDSYNFSYRIKKLHLHSSVKYTWLFYNGSDKYEKEIKLFGKAKADENNGVGYKFENDGTYFYYVNGDKKLLLNAHKDTTILETPAGVTLANGAFHSCENAVPSGEIVYQSGVQYLFYNCKKLIQVTIPNSVISIGGYAFSGCTSLTSITIPNSVTSIGSRAFYGCSSLTSITIPNSVTSIGEYAFANCSSITTMTIGNGLTTLETGLAVNCRSLKNVIINGNITAIKGWNSAGAFQNTKIESLKIQGTFTNFNYAIGGCTLLKTLILDVNTPPSTFEGDYFGDRSNYKATTVYVPDNSISQYEAHGFWSNYTIKPISEAPEL